MKIGVIKETKVKEHRVVLIPEDVKKLIEAGHEVYIENNAGLEAGFNNEDYQEAGAIIVSTEEVYNMTMLCRVKEPPISSLKEDQILVGYLHVEKNQNPELLNALLEKNVTAYAMEEFRSQKNPNIRLIGLGFEAGVVGMFEGLRTYGKMLEEKELENPFHKVKSMWEYPNKTEAYLAIRRINPKKIKFKVAIAGYGKVSKGAQEVLAQVSCPPLILREEDTYRAKIMGNDFAYIWKHLPEIDIFVNAIVWKPGQERILTNEDLEKMTNDSLIIDVSCDAGGGIQSCRPTSWENPTYDVNTSNKKKIKFYCVDNLPSAMAHDVSISLSRMAVKQILKIANGEEVTSGLMTKEGKFVYTPV
ncbi:hypothetical protein HN385_05390 [archaeon]|nr:hypothetical protein [archaeon]MBT3450960.1 hypothetical protein [archaeon]MBT6869483.1 hypothetical protein [archaeon]MBT7193171.1 hypothetical protein [archaeon]MBT7380477.1 hypothetical protein [archaeon]